MSASAPRLLGATLRVRWTDPWRGALALVAGDVAVGEIVRDAERTRLEAEGQEWWVEARGVRVLRAVVTDPEREPLLVYAGSLDWGAALTRQGRTLTVEVGARWARWTPLPGTVADGEGRTVLEVAPLWEPGALGWTVRTARRPGAELDVPPALALWGALVLLRRRAPWLRWTTAGLRAERIENELDALWEELP